jgi:hypothetical protein
MNLLFVGVADEMATRSSCSVINRNRYFVFLEVKQSISFAQVGSEIYIALSDELV